MSEQNNQLDSVVECPYCHSYNFQVNYVPFGGGLIIRSLCGTCGLKSESMSDSLRVAFGFKVLGNVGSLVLE